MADVQQDLISVDITVVDAHIFLKVSTVPDLYYLCRSDDYPQVANKEIEAQGVSDSGFSYLTSWTGGALSSTYLEGGKRPCMDLGLRVSFDQWAHSQ
jgi:hypothetical protein